MRHLNNTHSSTFSVPVSVTPLTSFEPVTAQTRKQKVRSMQALATLPALFVSHGAPTLALEKSAATNALARTGQNLPKPKAIVIMSAHWVTQTLEIASNPAPQTWHDFSGFSHELNSIEYPASGHPELAESFVRST